MRFRPEQHLRRQGDFDHVRASGRRYDAGAFTLFFAPSSAKASAGAAPAEPAPSLLGAPASSRHPIFPSDTPSPELASVLPAPSSSLPARSSPPPPARAGFGGGVKLGADRRWLNKKGHKAGADVEYSERLQQAGLQYKIPRPARNDRSYDFGVGYRDETTEVNRSRNFQLAATRSERRWHGFTR
ncbi:MAG: hypothetical protein H7067_12920, partial [Burkholderiales bacterium]|nr:hypothetical protein [Opitutaceae bacterium]